MQYCTCSTDPKTLNFLYPISNQIVQYCMQYYMLYRPKKINKIFIPYFKPNCQNRCPISDQTKYTYLNYKWAFKNTMVVLLQSDDPQQKSWSKLNKKCLYGPLNLCENQTVSQTPQAKCISLSDQIGPKTTLLKGAHIHKVS